MWGGWGVAEMLWRGDCLSVELQLQVFPLVLTQSMKTLNPELRFAEGG